MRKRFSEIQRKNPGWSSHTCFAKAISGQGFSKRVIYYWFNRLVDEEDYGKSEKLKILAHLLESQGP